MGCFPHTDRRLCAVPVSTLAFVHQLYFQYLAFLLILPYTRAQNVPILCNVKESDRTLLCPLLLWFSHWSADALFPHLPSPVSSELSSEELIPMNELLLSLSNIASIFRGGGVCVCVSVNRPHWPRPCGQLMHITECEVWLSKACNCDLCSLITVWKIPILCGCCSVGINVHCLYQDVTPLISGFYQKHFTPRIDTVEFCKNAICVP